MCHRQKVLVQPPKRVPLRPVSYQWIEIYRLEPLRPLRGNLRFPVYDKLGPLTPRYWSTEDFQQVLNPL